MLSRTSPIHLLASHDLHKHIPTTNQGVRSPICARFVRRIAFNSFRFMLPGRKRNPLPPQHMHFRDTLNPNVVPVQVPTTELSATQPPSAPRYREKSQATRDPSGLSTMGAASRLPLITLDQRLSKNRLTFHSRSSLHRQGRQSSRFCQSISPSSVWPVRYKCQRRLEVAPPGTDWQLFINCAYDSFHSTGHHPTRLQV